MKCEDVLIFVCICLCQLAGAISYSIANPIYPFEVGILFFSGGRGGGGDSSPFTLSLCHVKDCNFSACWFNNSIISPSIYKFGLSVCLFVSNKRQNG